MNEDYELELYKLIMIPDVLYVSEFGWISDKKFFVWVDFSQLGQFLKKLTEIFGYEIFNDENFNANIQADTVCIDLNDVLNGYVDIEKVFPKDKFKH